MILPILPGSDMILGMRDDSGNALTVHASPRGHTGLIVSSPGNPQSIVVYLGRADRIQVIRALNQAGQISAEDSGGALEVAPTNEAEAMLAYAEELESLGHEGYIVSDPVIRIMLAACTSVAQMRAAIEMAAEEAAAQAEQVPTGEEKL